METIATLCGIAAENSGSGDAIGEELLLTAMEQEIQGRVVVITGAGQGIGAAITRRFAKQ